MRTRIHRESPANVPLVRQMLADREARLVPRAVDHRWSYDKFIPIKVSGFNPLSGSIYYAATSAMADWLAEPLGPARKYNFRDRLMREALMAAHDYLHVWAYATIARLKPELGLGSAAITPKNLDAFVFCHLLTEAVATVGLDYWYLATVELADVCDIGSNLEGLTIGYHDRYLPEYRKFSPDVNVHTQAFFDSVVRSYCTGVFSGFTASDVSQSARLFKWVHHELDYGKKQRQYARLWLCHLAPRAIPLKEPELGAPVAATAKWQKALTRELGALLWKKVKDDELLACKPAENTWASPDDAHPDFRFVNLNALGESQLGALDWSRVSGQSFDHFFFQYLSSLDFARFDPELSKLFGVMKDAKDAALVRAVLGGQPRLRKARNEPRDILLLN